MRLFRLLVVLDVAFTPAVAYGYFELKWARKNFSERPSKPLDMNFGADSKSVNVRV